MAARGIDLQTWCLQNDKQDLLDEWDYEKNGNLTPCNTSYGSAKKVWWVGKCGHKWDTTVNNRTSVAKSGNCPYCSNQKLLKGFNDLATRFPEVALEWHPTKNGELKPCDIMSKVDKKFWWRCSMGHEWEATVGSRTHMKSGCPYCSGKKPIVGETDLATTHPEIVEEWHPTKNKLTPQEVSKGSEKTVWWLGKCGHEWQAKINNRIYENAGCPICDKENHTSFPEQALIFYLRKYYPDVISSDKETIGMELDIYIPSLKIAIEYDGEAWHKQHKSREREIKKNRLCQDNNILLIRIREKGLELYDNCYCIVREDTTNKSLSETIKKVFLDIDCISNVDVDIDRDFMLIRSSYITCCKENSLQNLYPELAKEWHPIKNEKIKVDMISSGSSQKVWWKCSKGHEWQAIVYSRVRGNGCPYCRNLFVLEGFNDLATANPNFLQEWDYEKNEIKPTEITVGSDKKIWWKCQSCGNQWLASVGSRTRGRGCPKCAKIKGGKNKTKNHIQEAGSLEDKYSELAKEWHPIKNGDLKPSNVTIGSHTKVWWKCSVCSYEWEAEIKSRVSGRGCSKCGRKKTVEAKSKSVICIETGITYTGMKEASEKTGINRQSIGDCCRGRHHTAGGYHWKYVK